MKTAINIVNWFFGRTKTVLSMTFLLVGILGVSQTPNIITKNTDVPEKIYLQLDSNEYTSSQTIWFKAIVTDSRDHTPTSLSGILYVDLIDSNNQIVTHKLIKLSSGIGRGNIDLKDGSSGQFLIRAYTQWNRNFGENFTFKKYVNVYDIGEQHSKDPFAELKVVQNDEGKMYLSGTPNFGKEKSSGPNEISVLLDWGIEKEEVILKENNLYLLNSEIPKKAKWVELSLKGFGGLKYSKTLVLDDTSLDLQFFPEGGKMVSGFQNKIGFKVLGFDGKGRKIQGAVFDSQGNKLTTFGSNPQGMGFFNLNPVRGETYYAKIDATESFAVEKLYPLPKVHDQGTLLSVYWVNDKIRFQVNSNEPRDSVLLKASSRGFDYYLIEGSLKKGKLVSELPAENFPDGIIVFTLMDTQNKPLAERLFYNESGKGELQIQLKTAKESFLKREKTALDILISKSEKDTSIASLSAMVINKNEWRNGLEGNIKSQFLLESEIKGNIENPGNYFDKSNPDRFKDMDALLLTQGWRNYKYPTRRQSTTFFWPQPTLTVRGKTIPSSVKNKKKENFDLTLAAFGTETALYTATTDSLGNFRFLLDDTYGQNMRILLHATQTGKNKEKKKPKISLNNHPTPEANFEHNPFSKKIDTITRMVLKNQQERERVQTVFDSLYGVTQLDEVVVEDVRLTAERQKIYDKYGKPDVVISGDSIAKKEKKWSYGLYSVLLFSYPGEVIIEQFPDGFMLAQIPGGPSLVMIDGRLIQQYEYQYVPSIPPAIVENVELIKFAKSFKQSFLEVFPETHPMDLPPTGHIISITTKGKAGLYASDKQAPGTLNTVMEVFSPIKEFYVPKYDRLISENEQKPDLRSLIHWAPILYTDDKGKASTSFYNCDVPGDYIIIVEAISDDGRLGYQEKTFSVGE
ncbi:MAG: hypothetical protein AB3N18_17310 [Allomuricauda sp.]